MILLALYAVRLMLCHLDYILALFDNHSEVILIFKGLVWGCKFYNMIDCIKWKKIRFESFRIIQAEYSGQCNI